VRVPLSEKFQSSTSVRAMPSARGFSILLTTVSLVSPWRRGFRRLAPQLARLEEWGEPFSRRTSAPNWAKRSAPRRPRRPGSFSESTRIERRRETRARESPLTRHEARRASRGHRARRPSRPRARVRTRLVERVLRAPRGTESNNRPRARPRAQSNRRHCLIDARARRHSAEQLRVFRCDSAARSHLGLRVHRDR